MHMCVTSVFVCICEYRCLLMYAVYDLHIYVYVYVCRHIYVFNICVFAV